MRRIEMLRAIPSRHEVADLLGFKLKTLTYILYGKAEVDRYCSFQIPKKHGGHRTISAPAPDLKILQRRLADYLQDCITEINIDRKINTTISHGFRRNYSIRTNAFVHRGKRYVFNLDLHDFFGTINFGRVRGFFIKNEHFELHPDVATVLAQIACHNGSLPQGSPCSPVISNLIGHILDIRLAALAKKSGCDYSRYADDLTFSTNISSFPESIAFRDQNPESIVRISDGLGWIFESGKTELSRFFAWLGIGKESGRSDISMHNWHVGAELSEIITRSGFKINPTKTRMQYCDSRQEVTGLVVNRKVNVSSDYTRKTRALAHSLFRYGKFFIYTKTPDAEGNLIESKEEGTIEQLNGMLSFIDSVDQFNYELKALDEQLQPEEEFNSRQRVYQRFLFFKNFFFPKLATVICEGKTDNIYLRCAIKNLHKAYPDLAESDPTGEVKLKIKLYRYTKVSHRVSFLGGGTGDLQNFIEYYKKSCEPYNLHGKQNPTIILLDNDSGAKKIMNMVKNFMGSRFNPTDPFHYVSENLYVIPIPQKGGKDTKIEDYFAPAVLTMKINGKSFNPENDIDIGTEYSKQIFAVQVIRKNQTTVDFTDFTNVLDPIVAAINSNLHVS